MESNLANVTNISAISPFNQNDETYTDFYNEMNFLNTTKSLKKRIQIEEIKEEEDFGFSPLFKSSCIVTEDEYKAIKIENNLDNLNKDIEQVNVEIE